MTFLLAMACAAWAAPAAAAGVRRAPQGQIRVTTVPDGALLSCNGEPRDTTPVTLTGLEAGAYLLSVSREGYREARRTVHLLSGQRMVVEFRLEPIHGLVLVHSSPPGAEVFLAGALRGQTPLLMTDFPLGEHRLTIQAEGRLPRQIDLAVRDRTPRKVDVTLLSDSAELDVRSLPPGASVLVNGVPRGVTPCVVEEAPTGEVRIEIRLEGHRGYAETVRLEAGASLSLETVLEPIPGALQVVTLPPGARVYIDQHFRGEAPVLLEGLVPGRYRVRAELEGYEPDARYATVRSSATEVEEFRLERNSGTLMLVTEPAGVEVFINGVSHGATPAGASPAVSEPLKIDFLPRGEHVLQLTRRGYRHPPRRIRIEPDQILSLHERLTRLFIPDTVLQTRDGRELRGQVVRTYENGDIEFEISLGVIQRLEAAEILWMRPLGEVR